MRKSKLGVSWGLVLAALIAFVGACANTEYVAKGDGLLKKGDYVAAIDAYEKALVESPGNSRAEQGIKDARRGQALAYVAQAEKELAQGRFVSAMSQALKARDIPLDLEDVKVVRRIDRAVENTTRASEEQVKVFVKSNRYIDAVTLVGQLVRVDPALQEWGREVQAKAVAHYLEQAESRKSAGYPGSAALKLAVARQVGADVERAEIESHWASFRDPYCFSDPKLQVKAVGRVDPQAVTHIKTTLKDELDAVQARCGEGGQPLEVRVTVEKTEVVDTTEEVTLAEPLPGVEIKTEEVYFEEIPYTEVVEVTEYETRIEQVEHRDCAPRPGQRGCRSWVEEVEKKVPVKVEKEVQKVRKVRKTRPLTTPLPDDKVVKYPATAVTRRVSYAGSMKLAGFDDSIDFVVREESTDTAHGPVAERGVSLPEDPMEADEMEAVFAAANKALNAEVRRLLTNAINAWGAARAKTAAGLIEAGNLGGAEEAYLGTLVIGGKIDRSMSRFFSQEYGKAVPDVLAVLLDALGRTKAKDQGKAESLFPTRGAAFPERQQDDSESAKEPAEVADDAAAPAFPTRGEEPEKEAMTQEELDEIKALEEASMEAAEPVSRKSATASDDTKAAEGEKAPATKDGDGSPSRAPVAPAGE